MRIVGWFYKLFDFILPPLRFKLDKKKKLSKAESDKWADEVLADLERRKKRGYKD